MPTTRQSPSHRTNICAYSYSNAYLFVPVQDWSQPTTSLSPSYCTTILAHSSSSAYLYVPIQDWS